MCADHEHLCSMKCIYFRFICFLFDVCEIYNADTSGNLKYIYNLINLNLSL